jgi:hypothetical protein
VCKRTNIRHYARVAFSVTHRLGDMDKGRSDTDFEALLDELAIDDPEHPNVAVSHESGWTLGAFPRGRVIWEDIESDETAPRHRRGVTRSEVLSLFRALAAGDLATVEAVGWEPGYGR